MAKFRIRTIASPKGLGWTVRSDITIEAPSIAAARKQADAVADTQLQLSFAA
jgi:hypothetical protein